MMANIESPIPLSEIEAVLAWVDTFKLSRATKKINRDFSDAVLLAEILSVHYPKLVEMHNYPPRNSHSLKLNNWMTLNRKVLKKLRLSLCCNTMEQLANCTPGVIERVLVMVRDKIRRDEDLNKSLKDAEQNMSSGGSYYEACGDDDQVLMVPVKVRVNGILETIQQKVISYETFCAMKEELKDAKEANDVLKQKVDHLDSLLKLKEERINELQSQLERKQTWRKEVEVLTSNITIDSESVSSNINLKQECILLPVKTNSLKIVGSKTKLDESKIPVAKDSFKTISIPSLTEANINEINDTVDRIKSDVFKEIEMSDDLEDKMEGYPEIFEDFKDSVMRQDTITTIQETIQTEIDMNFTPKQYQDGLTSMVQ
ncbi:hypothetical protein PYW07_010244 [Mythimna separata]|uniref:Calponin-homology (CH) domain-containing protein n=1 Tax=Mythimna separata TaxID=271217 RepID=A0AAD7YHS8_MYTSE|nr:hypothetical protein PYW07_010244 [Mythimna separata]